MEPFVFGPARVFTRTRGAPFLLRGNAAMSHTHEYDGGTGLIVLMMGVVYGLVVGLAIGFGTWWWMTR